MRRKRHQEIPSYWDLPWCDECDERVLPDVTWTLEGTDADGNRGEWMGWRECPQCGSDI